MDRVSVFLILVKSLFCAGSVILGEAADKAMSHSPEHHCPNLHIQTRQPAFGSSTGHHFPYDFCVGVTGGGKGLLSAHSQTLATTNKIPFPHLVM